MSRENLPRKPSNSGVPTGRIVLGTAVVGLAGVSAWALTQESVESKQTNAIYKVVDVVSEIIWINIIQPYADPSKAKLLPDFPPLPPGMEQPRTLVISLNENMIGSKWDRKSGLRVALRPDVQKFLRIMSQYYEIVVWDTNSAMSMLPYLEQIDSQGQYFSASLFRDATTWKWGHRKDLSKLNRPLNRIISIDTDRSVAMQGENTIIIKKFDNLEDIDDDALMELAPFLESLVMNNVEDVRDVLKRYDEHDNIGATYNAKVEEQRNKEIADRDKGIGGALRSRFKSSGSQQQQQQQQLMMPPMMPPLGMPGAGPQGPGAPPAAPVPPTPFELQENKSRKTIWTRFRERVKANEEIAIAANQEWQVAMMEQQNEYVKYLEAQKNAAV